MSSDGEKTNGPGPDEPSDRDPHEVSLSLDTVLSLLAHHQRRELLGHLVDSADRTAGIEECVGHLVERTADRTGERPGEDDVMATLHHVHVPKLADAGVLDYDPRSRQLRYWGNDRLERWLDRTQAAERD